jgi:hypothetical protein
LRRGEHQLQRYERITGRRGELWSYRTTKFAARVKFKRMR